MQNLSTSIILALILIGLNQTFAQEIKVEKEQKINASEVPEMSHAWLISVFKLHQKVRWYKEITSGKTSFEAKFKHKNKKYSVEFSENGDFEDIEFLVSWKSLDDNLRNRLLNLLTGFEKIKIKKIQKQWTGDSQEDLKTAIQNSNSSEITERYEIVFQAKKDSKFHIWEALLSQDELISIKEVNLRSTANLDF